MRKTIIKMETQKRVLATLNKFKEVQTKRNFGAIEDAIEDSKAEALSYIESMRINYDDLENTIAETLDKIQIEIDILDSYSKELQEEYLNANEDFREVNQGLLDNNIDGGQFNEDVVKEMTGNFQNMISNVVRLVQISNEMVKI